jgi:hypothetical protein
LPNSGFDIKILTTDFIEVSLKWGVFKNLDFGGSTGA